MITRGRVLPMEIIDDVRQPVRSWCLRCWNTISPRLDNIRSGQGSCEHCGGKARLPDEKARQLARAWGFEPDPVIQYTNDTTRWPGRCLAHGHYCDPSLNARFSGGPCAGCADHGFKPDRSALLYLVTKSTLTAAKVGICEYSPTNARLYEHGRNGWSVLHALRFPVGREARAIEKATVEFVACSRLAPGNGEPPGLRWLHGDSRSAEHFCTGHLGRNTCGRHPFGLRGRRPGRRRDQRTQLTAIGSATTRRTRSTAPRRRARIEPAPAGTEGGLVGARVTSTTVYLPSSFWPGQR